jgi:hypothetical protein
VFTEVNDIEDYSLKHKKEQTNCIAKKIQYPSSIQNVGEDKGEIMRLEVFTAVKSTGYHPQICTYRHQFRSEIS